MTKKRGRKNLKPNKAIFEQLYYNESVTAEQLAKEYGVTKNTIYSWAYQMRKEKSNGNKRNERNKKRNKTF